MGGQKAKVKDNEEVRSQEPEVRSRRLEVGALSADGPDQNGPTDEKREAADRRDGAEPADISRAQKVKAAGEDDDADNERPSGGVEVGLGPARHCPSNGDQAERMIHLVAHADLEDIEHIGGELRFQRVGAEGAESDRDKSGDGAGEKEETVHGTPVFVGVLCSERFEIYLGRGRAAIERDDHLAFLDHDLAVIFAFA